MSCSAGQPPHEAAQKPTKKHFERRKTEKPTTRHNNSIDVPLNTISFFQFSFDSRSALSSARATIGATRALCDAFLLFDLNSFSSANKRFFEISSKKQWIQRKSERGSDVLTHFDESERVCLCARSAMRTEYRETQKNGKKKKNINFQFIVCHLTVTRFYFSLRWEAHSAE